MNRIAALSALIALLVLAPTPSASVSPIQPLKAVTTGRIFCTTFSINPTKGYWMTAMHCIQNDAGKPEMPYIGESGEETKLIAGFPDVDIAILGSTLTAPGLVLAPNAPGKGEIVSVTGFGYGFNPPTTFWGKVSNTINIYDRKYLIFDMAVWPGHSGSPVQDAIGQVISVTQISADGIGGGSTWEDLERRTAKYWGK